MENNEYNAAESAFYATLSAFFGVLTLTIKSDGKLHHFTTADGDACWYVLFGDGYAPGWYGKTGGDLVYTWGDHTPSGAQEIAQVMGRTDDVDAQLRAAQAPAKVAEQAKPAAPKKGSKK